MKKTIYAFFFALIFNPLHSLAQIDPSIDTVLAKKLILNGNGTDERFINLIKQKDINGCLACFSQEVFNRFPKERLKAELEHLAELYAKYPHPKNTSSITISSGSVGGYGHDNNALYELDSRYDFLKKR